MIEFGSVCSGIEAASVAFDPLGWAAAWFAEIEAFPSAVLAHRFPRVRNLGDMTLIARAVLEGTVSAPDVLCGGTPCQAFSVAGLRESLSDARGGLTLKFVELANAIDHVRTGRGDDECVVFWENVPGALSTKDNAFGCFLGALVGESEPLKPAGGKWTDAGCVYGPQRTVAWRVLDAQYFGLAQRRRRVFVVASAREGFDPAEVLFEREGLRRDSAPGRTAGQSPAFSTGPSTGGSRHNSHWNGGVHPPLSQASQTRAEGFDASEDGTGRGTPLVPVAWALGSHAGAADGDQTNRSHAAGGPVGSNISKECAYSLRAGRTQSVASVHLVAFDTTQITSAENRSDPKPGDPCHPLAAGAHPPAIAFDSTASGMNGFGVAEDVAGSLRCGTNGSGTSHAAVAFQSSQSGVRIGQTHATLDANNGPRRHNGVVEGMQVRRLTPTECERLQGFPDGWTLIPWRGKPAEECPDGPRYKALGNSWAVLVVSWIGARIDAQLRRAA